MTAQEALPRNVRTTDGHMGATRSMPDDRIMLMLDDGRSIVIDADRLQPQPDGTYLVALKPTDR